MSGDTMEHSETQGLAHLIATVAVGISALMLGFGVLSYVTTRWHIGDPTLMLLTAVALMLVAPFVVGVVFCWVAYHLPRAALAVALAVLWVTVAYALPALSNATDDVIQARWDSPEYAEQVEQWRAERPDHCDLPNVRCFPPPPQR